MKDTITYTELDGAYLLRFEGDIRVTLCASFDEFIDKMFANKQLYTIALDLSAAKNIDSTALGMIAKIAAKSQLSLGNSPTVYSNNPDIDRTLECMGLNQVLQLVDSVSSFELFLKNEQKEMPRADHTPEQMCEKVIDAHKALMALNSSNKETFKELVSGLEEEREQLNEDPVQ